MAYTGLFSRRAFRTTLRSALEGAALAGGLALPMGLLVPRELLGPALQGLGSAWAASSVSVAALVFTQPVSAKAFWWAFGGGMALRGLVLGAWMAVLWDEPGEVQAAVLGAYALGISLLLLLEYRHVIRK